MGGYPTLILSYPGIASHNRGKIGYFRCATESYYRIPILLQEVLRCCRKFSERVWRVMMG